jgi:histidine triad (HIT) family protein
MSENCVFCKIVSGDIPSEKVFEGEGVTAFRDIHPVAPTHILIIPNKHIASVNDLAAEDEAIAGRLMLVAKHLAAQENIDSDGYRLIINIGPYGGQEVFHLHLHLIGGRKMRHPMG